MARFSSAEQRYPIIAVMLALTACFAASTDAARMISGVSRLAGTITLMLSFYALVMFFLYSRQDLLLIRPAVVRLWQALLLVCVTAATSWIVVSQVSSPQQMVAAFCPFCVLTGLVAGPWHGLLPASRASDPAQVLENKEQKDDE